MKNNLSKKIKLICLDLDDTLVPTGLKPMHELNYNAILNVSKLGIKFIIITGRSFKRAYPYSFSINSEYLIVFGGSLIYKLPEQKIIWKKSIFKEDFKIINNFLDLYSEIFALSYFFDNEINEVFSFQKNKPNKEFFEHNISLEHMKPFNKINLKTDLLRINLFGPWNILKKIIIELNKLNLTVTNNKNSLLEITSIESTKSKSLEFLINEKLKISKLNIMTFGDSLNDIPLFKFLKYGIAVSNAQLPLKKIAFDICDHYKKQGVGKYLNKIFLKK